MTIEQAARQIADKCASHDDSGTLAQVEREYFHIASDALLEFRQAEAEAWSYCLSIHWLHAIQCNHEVRTDEALCVCGWRSVAQQTVGLAVAEWIKHVRGQMAG